MIYDSARSGSPLAGSNFWTWDGEEHTAWSGSTWSPEDRVPGDPPHEPQGFNSVYDTDASTLEIILAHARNMMSIGAPFAILGSASPPRNE
jgi:mannan endo-1,4-beta-mannosidase